MLALKGSRSREQVKEKTKSRADLAHETCVNPLVQQQLTGRFAEWREGPVKHLTHQGLKNSLQMDALNRAGYSMNFDGD